MGAEDPPGRARGRDHVSLSLDQRREILASMPWVAVSPGPELFDKRCEGHRTDMPVSAREAGAHAPYACKKRARWVFLGLDGRIRTFCWWHLRTEGFESSPAEMERFTTWQDEYLRTHPDVPDWNDEEPDEPLSRR